jgi:hypothetical protein
VLKESAKHVPGEADKLVARAHALFGGPTLTGQTEAALSRFAKRALHDANAHWKKQQYPPLIENALRQLLATAPDLQTC